MKIQLSSEYNRAIKENEERRRQLKDEYNPYLGSNHDEHLHVPSTLVPAA